MDFFNRRRHTLKHRTAGYFNDRFDGISDLLNRARGASIFDVGCNRGMVAHEFVRAGATLVHGCDIYEDGLKAAREIFSDWPFAFRFEYADLSGGPDALKQAFDGDYQRRYEIVLYLAVHHKLKRVMEPAELDRLLAHVVDRSGKWFTWRGFRSQFDEIAVAAEASGMKLVHYSNISQAVRDVSAIWHRPGLLESPPTGPVPLGRFSGPSDMDAE